MSFASSNSARIVSKFGGTSMGDADCMLRSARICLSQNSKLVIVSATSGTTNQLIEVGHQALKTDWGAVSKLIEAIRVRHIKISDDLKLKPESKLEMDTLFVELDSLAKGIFFLKDLSLKALDALQSLGERLSSILFTQALNNVAGPDRIAILFDARQILKTDNQFGKARPLQDQINENSNAFFKSILTSKNIGVTQGFIGSTQDGHTTTLGRGGSDYSAAIFAEGLNANILEIWTDVSGILTTDPRLVQEAKVIPEISFKETSELATFGAKVLHPATLWPAIKKNIPVFVASSFNPEAGGTWVKESVKDQPLIRALALRRKQALLTLSTPEMLQAHGFLFQIFKIFNDHKISIDAITTSEISVSMTLDETVLQRKDLILQLESIGEVSIETGVTLVSLIGNNIIHTPGLSKAIFETIPEINIRMICLGASKHNYCLLVKDSDSDSALKKLHHKFIG